MTWRELKVFIQGVPRGSATYRSLYGEVADWTPEAAILADIWDAYAAAHTSKRQPPTYPRPKPPVDGDS